MNEKLNRQIKFFECSTTQPSFLSENVESSCKARHQKEVQGPFTVVSDELAKSNLLGCRSTQHMHLITTNWNNNTPHGDSYGGSMRYFRSSSCPGPRIAPGGRARSSPSTTTTTERR